MGLPTFPQVCALVRNDMQKTGTYSRVQGRPPLCHCEERSDGTIRSPCGSTQQNATIPGEYARRHEFARGSANLSGFPAETRIATPVCALVRNDMQKEGRVRGCKGVLLGE